MSRILTLVLAVLVSSLIDSMGAMAEESADPPAQIGRLAAISGDVSYHATAEAAATDVSVNYPLTTGNRLATPPRAHATVDIAAGRFYLDGDSAMTIGALGPGTTSVSIEKGAVILRVLPGGAGQVFTVETPRGKLRVDQPGYFEIEVVEATGVVMVSALEGGAQFNETTVLSPGTNAIIAPDAGPVLGTATEDDFIRRIAADVAEAGENKLDAPSHVSPQVTGFHELQRHGLWIATEQYGWVWEPQVASNWTPFRDGRWAEIAPWGRTWIDDAPWGFAPSHYGRWTEVNDRWVWIPGNAGLASDNLSPMVSLFGTQGQGGQAATNWVPLGPEQPSAASSPVIVNNVRVISPSAAPKVINNTTVNNTTNVTTVVKPDRRPSVVFINPSVPSPPPSPPPSVSSPSGNLTGLGASGAPMQPGVSFPVSK
jgi:hypothetical protein